MSRVPVISLGAGVQSSTLLLMAAAGEFDTTPKLAIFSDTRHEPAGVYSYLDYLTLACASAGIEIARVSEMDLREAAEQDEYNPIPLFRKGKNGGQEIGRRQCTKVAKLYPIRHELRRRDLNHVEQWVGISLDEVQRMKPSGLKWLESRWPLIEKRMTRRDCLKWLEERGHPLPEKSACVFCPYHSDAIWRRMRDNDPESWNQAVDFDRTMRETRGEYVHGSMVPLEEVDLSTPEDRGQLSMLDPEGFNEECEGMCGI